MPLSTSSSSSSSAPPPPHFVLLPFMSKGHIIPQIHIARLLSQRNLFVTIFSTPKNTTFITSSLLGTSVTIKELPFPQEVVQPASTAENTEEIPSFSMSNFATFAISTKSIQPHFELALESLSPAVNCIVYDWFLYWSQESADKFSIPALTFNGMSNFADVLYYLAQTEKSSYSDKSDDEPFSFPTFPNLKLTKNDFDKAAIQLDLEKTDHSKKKKVDDELVTDFYKQITICKFKSQGMLVNSFYELEIKFLDYWNAHCVPRAWAIGPLCLSSTDQMVNTHDQQQHMIRPWLDWLDQKLACGNQVLYVSFGSQAVISPQQLWELAKGLVESNQTFIWVLNRSSMAENLISEFKDRVNGRGLILTEWVDQVEILEHESINVFLCHCGWNSVIEAISVGKPILAMPIMAEQHLNARILVDEFGIGLRIRAFDDDDDDSIRSADVQRMVREIMVGDAGHRARSKVKQFKEAAQVAIKEGGSSWCTLNNLIDAVKHAKL